MFKNLLMYTKANFWNNNWHLVKAFHYKSNFRPHLLSEMAAGRCVESISWLHPLICHSQIGSLAPSSHFRVLCRSIHAGSIHVHDGSADTCQTPLSPNNTYKIIRLLINRELQLHNYVGLSISVACVMYRSRLTHCNDYLQACILRKTWHSKTKCYKYEKITFCGVSTITWINVEAYLKYLK